MTVHTGGRGTSNGGGPSHLLSVSTNYKGRNPIPGFQHPNQGNRSVNNGGGRGRGQGNGGGRNDSSGGCNDQGNGRGYNDQSQGRGGVQQP